MSGISHRKYFAIGLAFTFSVMAPVLAEQTPSIPVFLMAEDNQTASSGTASLDFLTWAPESVSTTPSFLLPRRNVASTSNESLADGQIFPDVPLSPAKKEKLGRYQQALKLGTQEACPEFQRLADDKDFERHDFAKLRFWIFCSAMVKPDSNLSDIQVDHFPFMKDLKANAEMVVAERAGNWDTYLSLLMSQIRSSKNLREKTKSLELGLQVAELKGQPEHAKIYRADLERLAPRFIKAPKESDFLSVGQDWIVVREFDKGRSYLQKVINSKKSNFNEKRKAFQAFRNSYKVQQNKPQHLIEAEKYYRWLVKNKEWGLAADSGLYWVRALWTEGQKDRAQAEMQKMEARFQQRRRAHELDFIRGRMAEEDSQFEKALAFYDSALARGAKASSQAVKIEASRAWALLRLARHQEAAMAFESLANQAPEPSDQLRARFWQAKSLVKAGEAEKAKAVFKQVAYDDPVGYYGLIAFHELQTAIPPVNTSREVSLKGWNALKLEQEKAREAAQMGNEAAAFSTEEAPIENVANQDPNLAMPTSDSTAAVALAGSEVKPIVGVSSAAEQDPAAGVEAGSDTMGPAPTKNSSGLTAATTPLRETAAQKTSRALTLDEKVWITDLHLMGEKDVLQTYLDGLAADSGWDYTTDEGLQLLKSYARSGLYLPLFATIGKIEKEQREALLVSHPELLFPMDFSEKIHAAAAVQEIPPELIFSIIRQESAFNPSARSWADAMGLMQILPMQAKVVARELKMEFGGHEDLFLPEKNIPVGARMLRQGLNRYDGNFILAIASYNANDRAIRGWLKSRFREDPVEFIEEIAYEETRSYVKLVLRNYIFYKRLANPELALSFPSECLPDLQKFKHSETEEIVSR